MLKDRPSVPLGLAYFLLAAGQCWVMSQYGLFADEAFYWLEGQHLDWSYSELPGWTAWVMAFSEWLFPHHPFFLRLLPWLAALSIPWLALAINRLINPQSNDMAFGLVWALPLTGLVSVLALPDVWLLFFAFLSAFLTVGAIKHKQTIWYISLGISLALGINVHVRFWFFAFLLAVVTLSLCWHQRTTIQQFLRLSMPLAILGLVPILVFNFQHDFPLLSFQLKERHPWQFQFSHLWFFLIQWAVCTPLVFILWIKGLLKFRHFNQLQKILILTALCHWLIYALLGFFSDNLRLNLHWPLLSYGLVFAAIAWPRTPFTRTTLWTGLAAHAALLVTLMYWHLQSPPSQINIQVSNNALGGQALANKTQQLMSKHQKQRLVADHFMTAATLQYHLTNTNIKVMPHHLNDKHGRTPQLALMDMDINQAATSDDLIVIEQTALKLQDQPKYFQRLCNQHGGVQLLDQLDVKQGSRVYLFFEVGTGHCDLPAMFYSETHDNQISGWVFANKNQQNTELRIHSTAGTHTIQTRTQTVQGNAMFDGLDGERHVLLYFEQDLSSTVHSHQLSIQTQKITQYSQRFY